MQTKTKRLTESAMLISMAVVLELVQGFGPAAEIQPLDDDGDQDCQHKAPEAQDAHQVIPLLGR